MEKLEKYLEKINNFDKLKKDCIFVK